MKLKLDANGNAVITDGKPVYVYDDGKELPFDAPATVQKIAGLNGEAKAHREAKEAAEERLKMFAGIDDPAAARKAIETIKNIDDKKLVDSGKVEEVRAAAVKAYEDQFAAAAKTHAQEMAAMKASLDKAGADLHSEKIGGSFTRSKFIAEKFAIPADMVQARFGSAFAIEDGKIVAKDQSGNKIYSRTQPGELAGFDEALETLIDQYPYRDSIIKGSGASGSGAAASSQNAGGKKTITRAQFDAMSPTDKASTAQSINEGKAAITA